MIATTNVEPVPLESDTSRRRALGIYYTPRSAAGVLAKWAIRHQDDSVLEPSFGGCTILEAAVARLRAVGSASPAKQLRGFDIDESAFAHLRRVIGDRNSGQFAHVDFLTVNPESHRFSAVIGNPPFVSYHRMDSAQRREIRKWRTRYSPSFSMTASLWAYFLVHAVAFLKQGGRLAFVLPSAAMTADYARPLMESLRRSFERVMVYRLSEQLFIQAGAEERTVLLFAEGYDPDQINDGAYAERSAATIADLEAALFQSFAPANSSSASDSSELARQLLSKVRSAGTICPLSAFARVTIGEVVGDTAYFVKSMSDWDNLQIREKHLRPIVTKTRQLSGLRVTKKDTSGVYSTIPRLLSVSSLASSRAVAEYLGDYPKRAKQKNKTYAKREPWFAVTYRADADAFLGSLSHESPRIVLNSARISCANGLYKLTGREGVRWPSWLAAASLTSLFKVAAEMNARVRGSGALKLEPSDVGELFVPTSGPLPQRRANMQLIPRLDRLLRNGDYSSANRIADEALLIEPRVLTRSELRILRDYAQDLRGERLRFGLRQDVRP